MAAYLIGQIIIHDMEKFMPYVANTSAAIAKYGGEVLDVVEAKEVMEGNWPVGARTALVRFPSCLVSDEGNMPERPRLCHWPARSAQRRTSCMDSCPLRSECPYGCA